MSRARNSPRPPWSDESEDVSYAGLDVLMPYAAKDYKFASPGLQAAAMAGLSHHLHRLAAYTAASTDFSSDRHLVALELSLVTRVDAMRKQLRKVRADDRRPTLTEWAEIHGDDAAVAYAAASLAESRFSPDVVAAFMTDLRRREWKADRAAAIRALLTRRDARDLDCRYARANRALASRMPRCNNPMRGVPRYLYTDVGRTTRDERKMSRRATFSAGGNAADTNGWDNVVKNWEEHGEA